MGNPKRALLEELAQEAEALETANERLHARNLEYEEQARQMITEMERLRAPR